MPRLFTAIRLPQAQKEVLLSVMGGLPQVRWQTEDQLHLTLGFIGEVSDAQAEEIRLILSSIQFLPFSLKIKGVDMFGPARKPRLLWAGVESETPPKALQEKIINTLRRLGLEPEGTKYKPHVTLARIKGNNGDKLDLFLDHNMGLALDPFDVENFVLVKSHLAEAGAQYQVMETYPAGVV